MSDELPPWPGDCYQRAAKEMFLSGDNPEIRLVHADVESSYEPGQWVNHAWVEVPATFTMEDEDGREWQEPGVVVVDTSQPDPNAHIVPRDFYYEQCKPRNIRRYTFAEMVQQALKHRHDGPWPDPGETIQ